MVYPVNIEGHESFLDALLGKQRIIPDDTPYSGTRLSHSRFHEEILNQEGCQISYIRNRIIFAILSINVFYAMGFYE